MMCGRVQDFGTYRLEKELDVCDWDIVGSELCRATTQSLEASARSWSENLRPGTQLEFHMVEAKGCGDCHCRIVAESRDKYPMPPHEQWECFGPIATEDQIKYTEEKDMVKESMVFRGETEYTFSNGTNMEQDSKEIIKAGTALFQNDISVTDHTLQVILRGRSETDRSGHTRISVIDEPHSIGLEYTERIKNVCHLERNITVPYISSMENSSIRSYCYNLYPQGHFTGCVSITELLHPFRDSDFVLADFYFSYFHKAFEKYLQSFHAAEQISVTVIRKLLDKLPMTAEEKKAIALKKDEKYICFKLQERIETHFMPMDYMHALLCTFFPDQIFTVIRHEQIIGFMKISSSVSSPDPLFLFQDLLEKMNYTAGLSNYFTDLSMIHIFFMQAEYVIHHFPGNKNADTLRYFENNVLSYMLSQCVSDMPIEALTDSSLKRVMEYDRKKHTEYLYTLEIYLKNETSITRTSEELFIHRSSLIKRINKLKKLLQKDLEDPKLRLYYRIWFSLYRISTIS